MNIETFEIERFVRGSLHLIKCQEFDMPGIRIYMPVQISALFINDLTHGSIGNVVVDDLMFHGAKIVPNYEMSIVVCHIDMPIRGIEPLKLMLK